jgi:hypothetical protein
MNADRNLLFGILAFQLNFIDRQVLLTAFDPWTAMIPRAAELSHGVARRLPGAYHHA